MVLTGCTKEKYNCHFHITAKSYYNNSLIKTDYDIDVRNTEKDFHSHYDRICEDGVLDFHFDEKELEAGEYTIRVHGSIYVTSIGRYVSDEATYSVIVGLNDDNYFEKNYTLHLH